MEHNLFKPHNLEEGKHAVVGDCNGIPMAERYAQETPLFVKKILNLFFKDRKGSNKYHPSILDYGCGVGRISKEILLQSQYSKVIGVDPSKDMRDLAFIDISNPNFRVMAPYELTEEKIFDIAILVYVLQHIPSIEIREALQRIHYTLKDDGFLFYCSSDYRMCIRFDGKGFFDDRFLGVNLQEELSRFFELVGPGFTQEELDQNQIVKKMVTGEGGGLPHPTLVYKKKKINGPLFNARTDETKKEDSKKTPIKLILANPLAPGDILVSTSAIRDLHKAYPGEYETDIRVPTGCEQIFYNNPYITKIDDEEGRFIKLNYSEIHKSGLSGNHFAYAHTIDLAKELGRTIPHTTLRPDIFLSQDEKLWPSPVVVKHGYEGKYWIVNAGTKNDYTLKGYPYYQKVIDLLKDKIKFIQVGQLDHNHPALEDVIDMRGQTDIRELFRLTYCAQGILTCVSFPMHTAAALEKPCVVVAGGREGTRWELYPDHRFLYINGAIDCCKYDGCWKSKLSQCTHLIKGIPLCMELITPEMIVEAIQMYYKGNRLTYEL